MNRKVLLVTDGLFHPPLWGRLMLHRALGRMPGYVFTHARSLQNLPADLGVFSALVLHFHHKTITPAALGRLESFVREGGGILAIHAATASFKETLPYFDILGGRFIGHGPVTRMEITQAREDIFGPLGGFSVRDELYVHELRPGLTVHFTATLDGQDIPVVWTRQYGRGRVCYAVPGHTSESMSNPVYQQVLQRGLAWVCTGETAWTG